MQQAKLKVEKKIGPRSVKVDLQVLFFEEERIHYAYMPSLDLTGYGNNEKEAKESLTVVLDEFLRYTLNKKTLFTEMKRLGWEIKTRTSYFNVPQLSDLIKTNEQLKDIINSKQYTSFKYPVTLPEFA